ncbi:MAG TPA: redox-regulated ATPase YchF [Candidatus Paceibacterota bacterium]
MKLSLGIVGLPNVGKSTLFNILTKQKVLAANYPFATIDPNVGVVPVPDERVDKLAKLSNSKKVVPAVVEFYDIAGLVKGANQGEGLGNQFLTHIRDTQAIVVVIRTFRDDNVVHVESSIDPIRDLEILNAELALKDLDTLEKRFAKLEGEARTGDKTAVKNLDLLNKIREDLSVGSLIQKYAEEPIVKEMQLLTAKKQVYLLNGKPEDASEELKDKIKNIGADYVILNLAGVQEHTNKLEYVGMSDLIKKSYEILDLISFLTTGEDETRAWTIKRGEKAPEAAGAIHTDFEKKFIRAEVINWQKLMEAAHSTSSGQGAWAAAKQKGWLRLEGKEYVVQDGDVIVVRHG